MKKRIKITVIVLGVLVSVIALDTLQAKVFDNSPLLKIRDNLDGGTLDYIDKGIFVNHYHCNNNEKVTTWKKTKFACSMKELNNDEENKINWNEIINGNVDEELLLNNIDEDILKDIAKNLQEMIEEEQKEERENPNIVINEGWVRVFNKDQYKSVLQMGNVAIKPLFYILYKSENNGLYEYVCAKALEDITGIGNEVNDDGTKRWTTAKEYLEIFIEEVK